ncbi:MAG: 50S ribosomal protein L10 [Bacillota bacterium]
MVRPEKIEAVEQIQKRLAKARSVVLVNYRGLNAAKITELRKLLRQSKIEMKVVKNSALMIASRNLGFSGVEPMLVGPTALIIGYDDEVQAAKLASSFARENKELEIKGGILEGKAIDAKGVTTLAEVPGKEVLLGRVLGMLQSPFVRVASVFNAPLSKLAIVLEEVRKAKEAGQPAAS